MLHRIPRKPCERLPSSAKTVCLVCHFTAEGARGRRESEAGRRPARPAAVRSIPIRAGPEPVDARTGTGAERALRAPLHAHFVLRGAERTGAVGIGLAHKRAMLC